jgi:hypothetical protein
LNKFPDVASARHRRREPKKRSFAMFDLSQPLQLYRSHRMSPKRLQLFVCEWESIGIASVPGGVFLVEAGHRLDARQTAKKSLRDGIVRSARFTFTIRPAIADEIEQVKHAPAGAVLEIELPARSPWLGDKDFVGESSTDLKAKPD